MTLTTIHGLNPDVKMCVAARWYASIALSVFPLRPGTKEPYAATHGHHDATTDEDVIASWWRTWPDANVGIACQPSHLAIIDIDHRNGGDEGDLEVLPSTWRAQTGDGVHIYFNYTGDVLLDGAMLPGIDIKRNGYVVAPPSLHPSGRRYCWEVGYGPDDLPLAPLPESLAARAADRLRHGPGRLRRDLTALVIPRGERNIRLFKLAALLRRYGLGEDALTACLVAINRSHCTPPVEDAMVMRIAAGVARRYPTSRP